MCSLSRTKWAGLKDFSKHHVERQSCKSFRRICVQLWMGMAPLSNNPNSSRNSSLVQSSGRDACQAAPPKCSISPPIPQHLCRTGNCMTAFFSTTAYSLISFQYISESIRQRSTLLFPSRIWAQRGRNSGIWLVFCRDSILHFLFALLLGLCIPSRFVPECQVCPQQDYQAGSSVKQQQLYWSSQDLYHHRLPELQDAQNVLEENRHRF